MTLALRLCGDIGLSSSDGTPVSPPLGAKTLALLAFLALEPGPHRRERVTALFWGESPEEKAKASLRQALTHLREALGDILRVDRATVELSGPITCDVAEFLRLAPRNPEAALAIDVPSFLSNLPLRGCPAFEEWADDTRRDLSSRFAAIAGSCARGALARRAWREAQRFAERWSKLDPLADEPIAVLVEALYLAGERDTALSTYNRHAARLAKEVRRAPSPALVELASRLEHSAPEKAQPRRATESWYGQSPSFTASLIGRSAEWDALCDAWTAAAQGASRTLLIEGEPGAGKTRLADDFLRWVTSQGGVVLRGRAYDARAGAPFGAVIEALHTALDAPGLAGVDPEWLVEVARMLPQLRRSFPGLPEADNANVAANGWRLFEAVAQVLLALAEENPVAVLIDDLQWCDAESCSLLNFLVRRVSDAHVLWCATFTVGEIERDAPAARLARALRAGQGASCVTLAPLSEGDVLRLIRELGRVDAPTDGQRLAARIHEVTAGNPFYVIELLKTLFAQGLLTIDAASGAWIVPQSALASTGPTEVAPTVHDTVAERIECLPDEIHAVLISLASSGRGCRTDVLSHMHGISRLHAAMLGDALVERHLATEEEGVYRCAHPTIAHVVRARLSTSRRREVHRALALTLELLSTGEGSLASQAGEIATHAEQAGDQPMTYKYALLASEAAIARAAFDEALSWLDLASGSAGNAKESDVVNQITARVLEQAGWPEAPAVRAPASSPRVLHQDLDLPVRA